MIGGIEKLLLAPLTRQIKWRIFSSFLLMNIPGLWRIYRDADRIRFPFFGSKILASAIHPLQGAFSEIFVDLEYWFPSGTKTPLIIDGGSNIGLSILFFKTVYPQATVIGFEPSPKSFALLENNIRSYNLQGVELHQLAVGASERMVNLVTDPNDPGCKTASTIQQRKPWNTETIPVEQVRLSTYITRQVDLLKLDVEGAEADVLDDLIASKKITLIDRMIIEYHHHLQNDHDALGTFLTRLEQAGFGYIINTKKWDLKKKRPGRFQDIGIFVYKKNMGTKDDKSYQEHL